MCIENNNSVNLYIEEKIYFQQTKINTIRFEMYTFIHINGYSNAV